LSFFISAQATHQLRDIEILVQQQMEVVEAAGGEDITLKEIQKILYSTEVCAMSKNYSLYSLSGCFRRDSRSLKPQGKWTRKKPSSRIYHLEINPYHFHIMPSMYMTAFEIVRFPAFSVWHFGAAF